MEQAALQDILPEIGKRGARLVTLSPQLPEFSRAWIEEDGIEFDVLTDFGLGVARDYGLTFEVSGPLRDVYLETFKIDLTRFNGDESWQLPIPATFVIAPDGTVAYASVDADYTTRAEPSEILDALDALEG